MTNFPIHCLPTPKIIDDGPIRLSHLLCFANPTPPSSSSSLLEQVHVQCGAYLGGGLDSSQAGQPVPGARYSQVAWQKRCEAGHERQMFGLPHVRGKPGHVVAPSG